MTTWQLIRTRLCLGTLCVVAALGASTRSAAPGETRRLTRSELLQLVREWDQSRHAALKEHVKKNLLSYVDELVGLAAEADEWGSDSLEEARTVRGVGHALGSNDGAVVSRLAVALAKRGLPEHLTFFLGTGFRENQGVVSLAWRDYLAKPQDPGFVDTMLVVLTPFSKELDPVFLDRCRGLLHATDPALIQTALRALVQSSVEYAWIEGELERLWRAPVPASLSSYALTYWLLRNGDSISARIAACLACLERGEAPLTTAAAAGLLCLLPGNTSTSALELFFKDSNRLSKGIRRGLALRLFAGMGLTEGTLIALSRLAKSVPNAAPRAILILSKADRANELAAIQGIVGALTSRNAGVRVSASGALARMGVHTDISLPAIRKARDAATGWERMAHQQAIEILAP